VLRVVIVGDDDAPPARRSAAGQDLVERFAERFLRIRLDAIMQIMPDSAREHLEVGGRLLDELILHGVRERKGEGRQRDEADGRNRESDPLEPGAFERRLAVAVRVEAIGAPYRFRVTHRTSCGARHK
jgi:hypothetical protein